MDEAFQGLRKCLCSCVVLNVRCAKDYFVLYTDASGGRVGACLHVRREEQELPVAFFSRQLRSAEKSYFVTELEGVAVVVYTDHHACSHFCPAGS